MQRDGHPQRVLAMHWCTCGGGRGGGLSGRAGSLERWGVLAAEGEARAG